MTVCTRNCWIAGAVAGVAVAALLRLALHMALAPAAFLGLSVFVLAGAGMVLAFCRGSAKAEAVASAVAAVPQAPEAPPEVAAVPEPEVSPEAAVLPEPEAAPIAPTAAPVQARSEAAVTADAVTQAAEIAPASPAPDRAALRAARVARRKQAAAEAAATATDAPAKPKLTKAEREARAARRAARQARAAAAAAAATVDGAPELLAEPRGGKADDLKAIKGVGPKFEKLLNTNGIWHYDQIAAWGPKDIEAIDARLEGFSGRIVRDGWVEQAKTLSAGGATAFSRRVAEGDVYKGTE
ncbi:MAG: hypothetical protein Q8J98_06345 [Phaeovulum sp.]|uniref:hypothetical protein n=1 Tax=Phaeovulum sp. TaxID=2934796 RepID=UPI0027321830|nr:hypothetical protein [Phaeovulum sp.]MDP2062714.1 hypothetical protein [Phaeovulum sp.]